MTRDRLPTRVLVLAAGAVIIRLLLFLGRGDYLAFDEGFYLLLARSLATGDGYSLIGIPHTALSPLFPLLAAGAASLVDSWVWGGRVVAAVASGLVVLPAWAVFRRLAPPRTAFIAAALIAVLPPLAPFVVPFWIGADLWVGAEPLLHLFLYTGLALWLAADERGGMGWWAGAGAVFGLAFLARPEAIIVWGLLGLASLGFAALYRSPARVAGPALMGLGFVVVCLPYWSYLHDVTGRWTLTGRGVAPTEAAAQAVGGAGGGGPAGTIERMLWQDDRSYERVLYGLHPSGVRMGSDYWGVHPDPAPADPAATARAEPPAPGDEEVVGTETALQEGAGRGSVLSRYGRSMGMILPLLLWPFAILGMAQPRPRAVLRRELPVALSLVGTSLVIAVAVAVDARTQLFLVPLLAYYAARGFSLLEEEVQRRARGAGIRPGFVELGLAAIAVVWLTAIDARRLYLSLELGSPHHIVGAQNRAVAEELDALLPDDPAVVMSWHPAIAVFADRDWRPLPFADFPRIIRFASAADADVIVASAYYPPDLAVERLDTRYLLLPVPTGADRLRSWSLELVAGDSIRTVGRLVGR